jgi:hypothetical protein
MKLLVCIKDLDFDFSKVEDLSDMGTNLFGIRAKTLGKQRHILQGGIMAFGITVGRSSIGYIELKLWRLDNNGIYYDNAGKSH